MNLDKEFEKLLYEMYEEMVKKIQVRQDDGIYDKFDAQYLLEKLDHLKDHDNTYINPCPYGHSDPDCGWSPSMGYHC